MNTELNDTDKKIASKVINDNILKKIQISSQERVLINSLENFYLKDDMKNIDIMLPIINSSSKISLRVLDHFVTNYSKKYRIIYNITISNNNHKLFRVNAAYKDQLKAYNKKYFDPFCRGNRIPWFYGQEGEKCIITTIGQLNFFKWAITTHIINYVANNLSDIEDDMNKIYKSDTKKVKKIINNITSINNNTIKLKQSNIQHHDRYKLKNVNSEKQRIKIMVTFE